MQAAGSAGRARPRLSDPLPRSHQREPRRPEPAADPRAGRRASAVLCVRGRAGPAAGASGNARWRSRSVSSCCSRSWCSSSTTTSRASSRGEGGLTRILAIDTATWRCSVALVEDGVVLAERAERTSSNHAGTLPRLVAETPGRGREASGRTTRSRSRSGRDRSPDCASRSASPRASRSPGGYRAGRRPDARRLGASWPRPCRVGCAPLSMRASARSTPPLYERDGDRLDAVRRAVCDRRGASGGRRRGRRARSSATPSSRTASVSAGARRRTRACCPRRRTHRARCAVARLAAVRLGAAAAGDDARGRSRRATCGRPKPSSRRAYIRRRRRHIALDFVDKVPIVY